MDWGEKTVREMVWHGSELVWRIVAYISWISGMQWEDVLMKGLRCLEYRGYNSIELAVHVGETIKVVRAVGKLTQLEGALFYGLSPLENRAGS
ncbi:hypothetical protein [Pajaroellobacter abortibovis]|uniref:Glutamine amidotransferase type-2 domain-containing protein n=1 Tax=Pajaroellobacter abortibovis TaxID=1882918 RepID=A0A1L6MYH1_9BACT|nr:hypothetical protein [Pajaroellobacter abortibovis]APS00623.1 hypothetical protein BCY86_08015 [Pajaroellobacter abortibovis]